jgi:hypothetical protein
MDAKDDVASLVPLALDALADLLDTTPEKLPAGIQGVLTHFGAACHTKGWEQAHDEPTNPKLTTVPMFPAVLPSGVASKKEG